MNNLHLFHRVKEIALDLISIPSVSGSSEIANCVDYCDQLLKKVGLQTFQLTGPLSTNPNLIAFLPGKDPQCPPHFWSGHLDVVPITGQPWLDDPFKMRTFPDRWVGRGTADMKVFIACALAVIEARSPLNPEKTLALIFTADEEIGCLGARDLLPLWEKNIPFPVPKSGIIGEPTSLSPLDRHKGIEKFYFTARGKAGHSSRPLEGESAIKKAVQFMAQLGVCEGDLQKLSSPHYDIPHPTLNIGTLTGGCALNVIPDRCEVGFEIRPTAEWDFQKFKSELEQWVIANLQDCQLENVQSAPPFYPSTRGNLAELLNEFSGNCPFQGGSFYSEAGIFQGWGGEIYLCGPGSIAHAHKAEEFIPILEVEKNIQLLQFLYQRECL